MEKEKSGSIFKKTGNIITALFLMILTVIYPFYFTNGYSNIGTDKSIFFRYMGGTMIIIMVPLAIACIVTSVSQHKLKNLGESFTLTDKFILGYALTVVFSYILSGNKKEAFLGANGWFIGFLTQCIYITIYLAVSRFLQWRKGYLYFLGAGSMLVFLLGILNRFSCYPIPMEGGNSGFISTLGNINWFCGYWSIFFALGAGLYMASSHAKRWEQILLGIYVMLAAAMGATQGSDSAMLVFAAVFLMLFMCGTNEAKVRMRFYRLLLLISCSFLAVSWIRKQFPEAMNYTSISADLLTGGYVPFILFLMAAFFYAFLYIMQQKGVESRHLSRGFKRIVLTIILSVLGIYIVCLIMNTVHPGFLGKWSQNPLLCFNAKWGSSRGATWKAGITVFGEQPFWRKWIGLGPDSFAYGVYAAGSKATEAVVEMFGNARLTNAHNEWITVLVNTGILGLVTNMGFFLSAAGTYLKKQEKYPVVFACGVAIISYMVHNIFSFQQALNGPYVYLVVGIGACILRKYKNDKSA